MKIRLLTPQNLLVQTGTEIDVDDGRAALLVQIGAAEIAVPVPEKTVEVETADIKPKKVRKKV